MSDFDTTVAKAAGKAAKRCWPQHRRYVERDDIRQEVLLWAYSEGRPIVEKALRRGDVARVFRGAYIAAREFCRAEQRHAQGPALYAAADADMDELRLLVQVVLDGPTETGEEEPLARGGTLGQLVADVRAALAACTDAAAVLLVASDDSSDAFQDALCEISEWLNGPRTKGKAA